MTSFIIDSQNVKCEEFCFRPFYRPFNSYCQVFMTCKVNLSEIPILEIS